MNVNATFQMVQIKSTVDVSIASGRETFKICQELVHQTLDQCQCFLQFVDYRHWSEVTNVRGIFVPFLTGTKQMIFHSAARENLETLTTTSASHSGSVKCHRWYHLLLKQMGICV